MIQLEINKKSEISDLSDIETKELTLLINIMISILESSFLNIIIDINKFDIATHFYAIGGIVNIILCLDKIKVINLSNIKRHEISSKLKEIFTDRRIIFDN